jgi:TusA-related sulfurtransferase
VHTCINGMGETCPGPSLIPRATAQQAPTGEEFVTILLSAGPGEPAPPVDESLS